VAVYTDLDHQRVPQIILAGAFLIVTAVASGDDDRRLIVVDKDRSGNHMLGFHLLLLFAVGARPDIDFFFCLTHPISPSSTSVEIYKQDSPSSLAKINVF
jgi:hypothetical protein